jgi:hypothetical protein
MQRCFWSCFRLCCVETSVGMRVVCVARMQPTKMAFTEHTDALFDTLATMRRAPCIKLHETSIVRITIAQGYEYIVTSTPQAVLYFQGTMACAIIHGSRNYSFKRPLVLFPDFLFLLWREVVLHVTVLFRPPTSQRGNAGHRQRPSSFPMWSTSNI